ncbi:hypothetical protein [Bifidobacterium leontopitheci]|uniref:Uncharacterized protein n=1 Tax=Bifidobacterium leontopitheci TaxID=2650774 RepID=A0A6I1GGW4_9BIFI|nr:hypothetical protein [Bifidobacterium leontopitheci]KAB7790923.1 hypothetical protein F7D09_0469 [Bifidobacterium leontopitheci]
MMTERMTNLYNALINRYFATCRAWMAERLAELSSHADERDLFAFWYPRRASLIA